MTKRVKQKAASSGGKVNKMDKSCVSINLDSSEIDKAIEKANQLVELLREARQLISLLNNK